MFQMVFLGHAVYIDVINKFFSETCPYILSKNFGHGFWKGISGIIHTKRHYILIKHIKFGDQCSFLTSFSDILIC
jgi:hypothetical protein